MALRTFNNQNPSASISEFLPIELKLYIFRFLRARSLLRVSEVNTNSYVLANDNSLWVDLYQNDFGLMLTTKDAKIQYMAEHLYRRARRCPRRDVAQIYFSDLHALLVRFGQRPWAKFYLGVMYRDGLGVTRKPDRGLKLLLEACDAKDYRAVMQIIQIICYTQRFPIDTHIKRRVKLFLPILTSAWNQGATQVAWSIANLYKSGIGITPNPGVAKQWFYHALDTGDVSVISEVININSLDEYNALANKYAGSTKVLGIIYFLLGGYYQRSGDDASATESFVNAANLGSTGANVQLAIQELYRPALTNQEKLVCVNKAIEYLKPGFENNHETSVCILFCALRTKCQLTGEPPDSVINYFKQRFIQNGCESFIYAVYPHLTIDLADPEFIWWQQLAAQAFNKTARDELIKSGDKNDSSPYIKCALGILYTFGVLGSDDLKIDPEKGRDYLSRVDPDSLRTYLQTGIEKGLITDAAKQLLKENLKHKIRAIRFPPAEEDCLEGVCTPPKL